MTVDEAVAKMVPNRAYVLTRQTSKETVTLIKCGSCKTEFYTCAKPDYCMWCGQALDGPYDHSVADSEA